MMESSIGKSGLEDGNQPLTPPWHPATPAIQQCGNGAFPIENNHDSWVATAGAAGVPLSESEW